MIWLSFRLSLLSPLYLLTIYNIEIPSSPVIIITIIYFEEIENFFVLGFPEFNFETFVSHLGMCTGLGGLHIRSFIPTRFYPSPSIPSFLYYHIIQRNWNCFTKVHSRVQIHKSYFYGSVRFGWRKKLNWKEENSLAELASWLTSA